MGLPTSPGLFSPHEVELTSLTDRLDELSCSVESLKRGLPQLAESVHSVDSLIAESRLAQSMDHDEVTRRVDALEQGPPRSDVEKTSDSSLVAQKVEDLQRHLQRLQASCDTMQLDFQHMVSEVTDVAQLRHIKNDGGDEVSEADANQKVLCVQLENIEAKFDADIDKLRQEFNAALKFAPSHDDVQDFKAIYNKVEADRLEEELAHKSLLSKLNGFENLLAQVGDVVASEHGFEEDAEA